MRIGQFQDHSVLGFVDWTLRGVGQVVFQNNPLAGLVILAGLFVNSWIYAMICVLGVVVSTLTAIVLKADKALIREGLFGFNGALVALALIAFTSEDFRTGAVPSVAMTFYLVCAAALTTMAFATIATLLGPHKVAPLTMPFVLVGWLFLFAVLKFDAIEAGPIAKP
ncbi:MAG TPA: urea transporter, partial [Terriglobales bacterium]|nr:urea transporter [Terriglobales bacterium]